MEIWSFFFRLNLVEEVETLKRKQCIAKAVVEDQESVIQDYESELKAVKDVLSVVEKPVTIDDKGDIGKCLEISILGEMKKFY